MKDASRMLAAYLEGEVTPSEKAAIEAELAGSARARRRLDDLRGVRAALAAPIPDVEDVDLVEPVMRAIARGEGRGEPARRPGRRRGAWRAGVAAATVAAACLAGAAGVALLVRPRGDGELRAPAGAAGVALLASPRGDGELRAPAGAAGVALLASPRGDGEFRARAAAPQAAPGERWAGVQAYHVAGGGAPERLGARLPAGDGLLFAYTNLGPRPFAYLMIFAVDAGGAVRWCHPAYERAGTNPTSIPLRAGEARVQLAEVIRHELPPGPLEIRALFTMRPLGVLEVEAWLAGHPAASATVPLPWPEAALQVIETRVDAGGAP